MVFMLLFVIDQVKMDMIEEINVYIVRYYIDLLRKEESMYSSFLYI